MHRQVAVATHVRQQVVEGIPAPLRAEAAIHAHRQVVAGIHVHQLLAGLILALQVADNPG